MELIHKTLTRVVNRAQILCALLIFVGCSSLPPAPEGDMCIMSPARDFAYCCEIPKDKDEIEDPQNCYDLAIGEMENYTAFSPETWKNIRAYIKILEIQANLTLKKLDDLENESR
jgi:hypothetical protein